MPASHGRPAAADQLLASYAAGSLSLPMHALVASHLVLKPENRQYVAALEAVAADSMDNEPRLTAVAERGKRLAAIFGDVGESERADASDRLLPEPLARYVGAPHERLRWRTALPGLREARISDSGGVEASLLWIRAGTAMPSHTHPGMEATLVLKGSFCDAYGLYSRGDIAVADDEIDHKPIAGSDEDCICFAVSEGPVKLTGPVARLFSRLLGH